MTNEELFDENFDNATRHLVEFVNGKPSSRLHGLGEEERELLAFAYMAVNILLTLKVENLQDEKYMHKVGRSLHLAVLDAVD